MGEKKGSWSFTVDASIYTFAPIDDERLEGLADVAADLSVWIADEFGFHNVAWDTIGSGVNMPASSADSRGHGFYIVKLDVEDVNMAKGDYRLRSDINAANAHMRAESMRVESYSIVGLEVVPRLAPDIRMYVGPAIRELISEGIKRALARLAGR